MTAPILVVAGPCGAGKSTVGRPVASAFDPSVHLRVDDFTSSVVNAHPSQAAATGGTTTSTGSRRPSGRTRSLPLAVGGVGSCPPLACSRRLLPSWSAQLSLATATAVAFVTQHADAEYQPDGAVYAGDEDTASIGFILHVVVASDAASDPFFTYLDEAGDGYGGLEELRNGAQSVKTFSFTRK